MPEPSPSSQKSPVPNPDPRTLGVALLTGDPKKAIVKLSGPMIVVMLLMSTYNLVNAIWVAGLGADALAAVGFVSPLFMVLIGIGNGLGAGATSVISRRIGPATMREQTVRQSMPFFSRSSSPRSRRSRSSCSRIPS
ncbi:MAG: MATE family efflux transporter [Methanoregula sp.]